jgi:hypothetical protein
VKVSNRVEHYRESDRFPRGRDILPSSGQPSLRSGNDIGAHDWEFAPFEGSIFGEKNPEG